MFFVELSPKTHRNVAFQRYDLRFRLGGVASGFHFSWQAQYLVNL